MRRHHAGSGRRSVIPPDWAAHHRPVVAGTFTATVEIRHPGGTPGTFDSTTGTRPLTPHVPHYGAGARIPNARIQILPSMGADRETGAEQVVVASYLVVVDLAASAAVKVGDLVRITAIDGNGDQVLIGRDVTVTRVASGSLAWERDLQCTDPLG